MRAATIGLAAGLGLAVALVPAPAAADELCRVIDVDLNPVPELQIVVWIEDAAGTYVDTLWITHGVGAFGLGNRPGVFGMKSGPSWPYGARLDVFPVWSHRHGIAFPALFFRNSDGDPGGPPYCEDAACKNDNDRNLSHPLSHSSREVYYTRPLRPPPSPDEAAWDVGSVASPVFTDKGRIWFNTVDNAEVCASQAECRPGFECRRLIDDMRCQRPAAAVYPPRADVVFNPEFDDVSVTLFDQLNPFDEISGATPPGTGPFRFTAPLARDLAMGEYVLFVEVARELDHNATYNATSQPPITAGAWNEYGVPYRGQPSVVYRLPFTLGPADAIEMTDVYAGYGDPLAVDGVIRPPDATITTDVDGSGARRLGLAFDALTGGMYRVRMHRRTELDMTAPDAPGDPAVEHVDATSAAITFVAPGDDGATGRVAGYDVRLRATEPMTEATFDAAMPVSVALEVGPAGEVQRVALDNLLPRTTYYLGIRAYDDCRNIGPLEVIELETPDVDVPAVDACVVATAAYGSPLAADVELLRRVRDTALRTHVLGELAVEAYYTFGPALARVVGTSELLRETTRAALEPVVDAARAAD